METGNRNLSALETVVSMGGLSGALTAAAGYSVDNDIAQGIGYGMLIAAGVLYSVDKVANYFMNRKKSQSKNHGSSEDAINGGGG